jgi:gluconate 2-dehydrogenase gamma chain
MPPDEEIRTLSRRSLIASAALIPAAALAAPTAAQSVFSATERKTIEAFAGRLVPNDELGPGAVECGAINYIDQALAGALSEERSSFLQGIAALDAFSRKKYSALFAELDDDKKDAVLNAMDTGSAEGFDNARAVFARFRRLILEGMFSDPYYGGNTSFRGWDLIRYPGPRVAVAPEEQQMRTPIKPYRRSAIGANNGHQS